MTTKERIQLAYDMGGQPYSVGGMMAGEYNLDMIAQVIKEQARISALFPIEPLRGDAIWRGKAAVLSEILKHFEEDFVDDECLPFDGVIDREEETAEEMTKLNKEWVDSWFDFVKERIKTMEE